MSDFYKPRPERIGPKAGNLSEADTRVKIIDPLLKSSNWVEENIRREFYFKKGKVFVEGNQGRRGGKKYADE